MKELFGLPKKCVEDIRRIFSAVLSVERAVIFGSRAMGNYRPGSDVDLALFGNVSYDELLNIKSQLDEIPWAYMYDVVIYDKITNPAVQAHIDDFGLNFYEKEERTIENWSVMRLGDNCLKIGSGATPKGGQENYKTEGISLIRSQNVLDFTFSRDGLAFIDDKQAKELSNVEVSENDVLLNITGDSVARVCQVPKDVLPARVNQHVAIIRPKPEVLAANFLKYYLLNPKTKEFLLGLSSSGATRNALTKAMIENLEIFAPEDVSTQHRIAAILTALDDKIELNRRMNETLEGIAQAVWGEWFGKYASGEEELPEGWRWGNILEIAKLIGGGTPKTDVEEYWDGNISWISGKDITPNNRSIIIETEKKITKTGLENSSAKLLPALSTVISARGTVGNFCLIPTEMTISQSNYGLKSVVQNTDFFLFQQVANLVSEMQQKSYGTVFDTITTKTFSEIDIPIPSVSKMVEYNEAMKPLFEKRIGNLQQSRTLTALRDVLLPRLMRGEVIPL